MHRATTWLVLTGGLIALGGSLAVVGWQISELTTRIDAVLRSREAPMQTIETSWTTTTDAGVVLTHKVATTRNDGESLEAFTARHYAAVTAAVAASGG